MPRIIFLLRTFFIILLFLAFAGCSTPNDKSSFDPDTGHSAAWLPLDHKTSANTDITPCSDCHGSDYLGGISLVSCSSCHLGGTYSVHPTGWLGDACSNHGSYALLNGTTACASTYCHGADLTGVTLSGPSCTKCHDPIPTTSRCGTCHGIPPSGSSYPNIAGKHASHSSPVLTNVACSACHDRECDKHDNGTVEVGFKTIYDAKTGGSATFNAAAKICTNVSCHGGQTTPSFTNGSISVNTQCTVCHRAKTASDQYNSYYSGKHAFHLAIPVQCQECHDIAKLGLVHFVSLESHTMTASAQTITSLANYSGGSCSNFTCHGQTHDSESW